MNTIHSALSGTRSWLGKFRRTDSFSGRSRSASDIIAACNQIGMKSLDKGSVQKAVAEYWKMSGAHNYEKTWRPRLAEILDVISGGEVRLTRVLAEVLNRVEAKRNENLQPAEYVAFNESVKLPQIGGGYLHRGSVIRTVTKLCTPKTSTVLELGSGWGEHLCNLWLSGGPIDGNYFACELTENGRKCALALAELEPEFNLQAPCFNYVSPDFDFLHGKKSDVVVYSVHGVEQVRNVAPDLIERLCSLGDEVRGAHFEPIGWQMIPRNQWNSVTAKHEQRCGEMKYNENFWPQLQQAERDGLIVIDQAVPNFFGLEHNPASLIVWHKR